MIRRTTLVLVATVFVIVALTGCATARPAAPAHSAAPAARPSASATPAATDLPGCADFVAPAAFAMALGTDVSTPPRIYPMGAFAAVGGVGCEVQFGEPGFENGAELMYQILPASLATAAELRGSQAEAGTPKCQTDPNIMRSNSGCEAVLVLGGWWIEVRFSVNSTMQIQTAAVQPVLDLIRSALNGRTARTVAPLTAPSCDRFASAVAADPAYAGATVITSPPPDSAGDTRNGWPAVAVTRVVPSADCEIAARDGTKLGFSAIRSPAVAAACAAVTDATAWPVDTGLTITSTPYVSGGADLCATDGVTSLITDGTYTDADPMGEHWTAQTVTAITPILQELLTAAR